MDNVTGIIVSYNTRNLLSNCVSSIRKFLPSMKLIIVDGSTQSNPCFSFSKTLKDRNTSVLNVFQNIGHGKGMVKGIEICETEYFLLIDSDTIMKANPLPEMMDLIKNNYGIGQVVNVNTKGNNIEKGIKYLHPYFALIKKEQYLKYSSIINHGAPMLNSMIDLHLKNKSKLLVDFPVEKYIHHLGRGTRALNPKEFNPKHWDKV